MATNRRKRDARKVQQELGIPYSQALRVVSPDKEMPSLSALLDLQQHEPVDADLYTIECPDGCPHPILELGAGTIEPLGQCRDTDDGAHIHMAAQRADDVGRVRLSMHDGRHTVCASVSVNTEMFETWLKLTCGRGGGLVFAFGADLRVFRVAGDDAPGVLETLAEGEVAPINGWVWGERPPPEA
jgi:hypothetical protein